MKRTNSIFVVLIIFSFISFSFKLVFSQDSLETAQMPVTAWLKAGPVQMPLPAFNNASAKKFGVKDLLDFQVLNVKSLRPQTGETLPWKASTVLRWQKVTTGSGSMVALVDSSEKNPEIAWLATYLSIDRWTSAKVSVTTPHLFKAFLDGNEFISKSENSGDAEKTEPVEKEIKLETGKHLLLVEALFDPSEKSDWKISTVLKIPKKFGDEAVKQELLPQHIMDVVNLLEEPAVSDVAISPDGELAALMLKRSLPPGDESETWVELYRVNDGSLLRTYRGGTGIDNIQWAPTGNRFSYTTVKDEKSTLWIVNLSDGTAVPILENIENLSGYSWSPDGSFIIYNITDKPKEDKQDLKRLESLRDRWPWWRDRTFLYRVNVPEGTRQRLTAGKLTTDLQGISPDGRKLLFTREKDDYSVRPYTKTSLYTLDLQTLQMDSLWSGQWFNDARWSPDGKKLLLTGGPSMFGELGINVPDGRTPNDYDIQGYLMDVESKKIEPLTRDFDPSIDHAYWLKENEIYFTTTDRSDAHLYRLDLNKKKFKLIETGVDVVNRLSLAKNRPDAIYTGSSVSTPLKAYSIDLIKGKYKVLSDPAADDFQYVQFGKVESWDFKNERGTTIQGRVYYPPDFDPAEKYPCIVYYYGGTTPVERDFGGRYPKNLWAAQGYVVYVLQPSGAIGYGQAFSSWHVNDWGKEVAGEIIDGVKQFLAAHPFVDRARVGAIGASYGGFMTMLLVTKTDLFAAAVSHAGISDISSYWGEGYWGYLYSAVATANSFPWNRKDIYVGQSPLYSADKIHTPLLLVNGTADTNVPTGESNQLFTALKLLGRTVEYVQVPGANHWVVKYGQRKIWTKTIMAWFDKWLKDQPAWWGDLYPAQ